MNYVILGVFLLITLLLISGLLLTILISTEIPPVYSNLFLLIPAVTASYLNHRLRSLIYVFMCGFSALYHLCDSFDICLFSFEFHHNLDFFFAEYLIILGGLYLVEFTTKTQYIEYLLIFSGALVIVILQYTFSGELAVEAGIVTVVFIGIIIYWVIYKYKHGRLPEYNWSNLTLGLALTAGSIMLFSVQNSWHEGYWIVHSLWHTSAALGQHYILLCKKKAPLIQSAASKIKFTY